MLCSLRMKKVVKRVKHRRRTKLNLIRVKKTLHDARRPKCYNQQKTPSHARGIWFHTKCFSSLSNQNQGREMRHHPFSLDWIYKYETWKSLTSTLREGIVESYAVISGPM